jgi:tRNA (guanine37-N1)-methyltransferase
MLFYPKMLGATLPEEPCLKVTKNLGQQAIRLIGDLSIFNYELKIQQDDNHLYIPLTREPTPALLEKIREKLKQFEISKQKFPKQNKRSPKLLDYLADKLPPYLLPSVPRAIDFIGDIAIIEVPPELAEHKTTIGEAIMKAHKQTHTVLAKSGAIEGVYRLRDFEVVAGIEKTATIHREYGCSYHVDLAKAYFSPRLSSEHNRVTAQVDEGETVIDLFTGVGPFAIQIAKNHENVRIYAVDVNPDAVAMLKRNIALNRAEKQVIPILGDAWQVVGERLLNVADRVIMNLPETAIKYVNVACEALSANGGIMHYYEFTKGSEPLDTAKFRLTEAVSHSNRRVKKILLAKTVREVAPHTWQVVVDAEIQ